MAKRIDRPPFVKDPVSRFVADFRGNEHWRQVLDWKEAHIVDHGGSLWVWQPEGGYKLVLNFYDGPVFYDLNGVYD